LLTAPFGSLSNNARGGRLVSIDFLRNGVSEHESSNLVLVEAERRFSARSHDPKTCIDLPLQLNGTRFMQRVWQVLVNLLVGAGGTSAGLAELLAIRFCAIRTVCCANPLPLDTPCHRIVSVRGLAECAVTRWDQSCKSSFSYLKHEGCALT
jgi:methylated-DNA-[protein]-cysteine S-methyltransferase